MSPMNAATAQQVQAAQPLTSTWLAANAGSGKTRVLTNRVARLLLGGTRPEQILCLTYTKAAAAEMQNRLFLTLGKWSMWADEPLGAALEALGEKVPTSQQLRQARTLFACAIETPGGLQIQTIHAFCARLLRRFPLEAGVSPQFKQMDDRSGQVLIHQIIHRISAGDQAHLLDDLATQLGGDTDTLNKLALQLVRQRAAFQRPLTWPQLLEVFSLPSTMSEAALLAQVIQPDDLKLLDQLLPKLEASSTNDQKAAKKLKSLAAANPTMGDLALLESIFLYAKTPYRAKIDGKYPFPTKALRKTMGLEELEKLNDLMGRVEEGRQQRLGLAAAKRSMALYNFAAAFLPIYAQEKQRRGWLDFDDLIQKSQFLLRDSSAADWVLFRLDYGVDHILVDEAQDTSPGQWDVIEKLAQEFSSGEGARSLKRTIFVVGDKKQSIYSFQGADPNSFDTMKDLFQQRLQREDLQLKQLHLDYSFRSAPVILKLVDTLFANQEGAGFSPKERHQAFKANLPGRVDLWPLVVKTKAEDTPQWTNSEPLTQPISSAKILAKQVATFIHGLLRQNRETIPMAKPDGTVEHRAIRPEDILILVQRRSELFTEIIDNCKAKELPIAGADRLKLTAELAVKDLTALLHFLATPDDDLSLAAALKSPIFHWGEEHWGEEQLFKLAHHRPPNCSLGQALQKQACNYPKTVAILKDLRNKTDYLRPYELIERILTRHGARQRLIGRLGPEVEDGIEGLLSQALAYERTEIPSLTGFLLWATTDALEVKRQLSQASGMIRVMTVHGAKGLEAPIVILPDTLFQMKDNYAGQLTVTDHGDLLWNTKKDDRPDILENSSTKQQHKEQQERMRLLYVAMTRAQTWLIVAGAADKSKKKADESKEENTDESQKEKDNWYNHVYKGMEQLKTAVAGRKVEEGIAAQHLRGNGEFYPHGEILRLSCGHWPAPPQPQTDDQTGKEPPSLPNLPSHLLAPPQLPKAMAEPKVIKPSNLGGDKALAGDGELEPEQAMARGTAIHRLLEVLPSIPDGSWQDVAAPLLPQFSGAEREAMVKEAVNVLRAPALAEVFAEDSLAEVEFTITVAGGPMQGTMDRLLVRPDKVLAVDFKTNATVPTTPQECPEGILRQMGAYEQAINILYPGRPVEMAILWTRTATLMFLPSPLLQQAWQRAQAQLTHCNPSNHS